MDDLTDMGFSSPDHSPIPTVGDTALSCPTGTGPRMVGWSGFNNSDTPLNKGKAKIVDSFAGISDQLKQTKGGKVKNSQIAQTSMQLSTSHTSPPEIQIVHKSIVLPVVAWTI